MSDAFERRVGESLRSAAEDAPGATGLAAGARSRLRRRRRTTIAAAAAALVVVAVPVGISLASGDGDGDGSQVATDTSGGDEAPAWRTESWRDATVRVPADWGRGSLAAWCAGGATSPEPVVERPGTMAAAIACGEPARGYGVAFLDARSIMVSSNEKPPAQVPDSDDGGVPTGAWTGYKVVGATMVEVVAPDEETASAVYDSIELLEGPDANGCPQGLADAQAADGGKGGDQVSLCGYGEAEELEISRLLPEAESAELLAEVEDLPAVDLDCPQSGGTVVLRGGAYATTISPCAELSPTLRDLPAGS